MANTATVHLEPRDRRHIDGTMPFRRFYIGFRFLILAFEVAALGYLISLGVHYANRSGHYACGFVAIAMALALDGVAIGVLVHKKNLSNESGACFNCCDVVVLIISIIGCMLIFMADFSLEGSPRPEEWDTDEDIGGFMVMGIAIAHLLLSVAACIGSCVSCGRARRAKRQTERVVYLVPVMGPPPYTEAAK
ncbi:hypothetical protein GE09DRAFT_158359 [Coniochaeta sp. 2T2.1]|nr:hypothetical protein GE09DRAFT_158359 [Coniochaeta sp. 2T2.1]